MIMKNANKSLNYKSFQQKQKGFIFVLSLVLLIAMTLIGIAIVRSSDASNLIASAIGFKHSTLNASDASIENAINWLTANPSLLTADCPNAGYYASEQEGTDYTGSSSASTDDVSWSRNSISAANWVTADNNNSARCATTGANAADARIASDTISDTAGNRSSFIIQRLCTNAGPITVASGNSCGTGQTTTLTGASTGAVSYGNYSVGGVTQVYYRITIRTIGTRNAVSYTQAKVLMNN